MDVASNARWWCGFVRGWMILAEADAFVQTQTFLSDAKPFCPSSDHCVSGRTFFSWSNDFAQMEKILSEVGRFVPRWDDFVEGPQILSEVG